MFIAYPKLIASELEDVAGRSAPVSTEVVTAPEQLEVVTPTSQVASSTSEPQEAVVTSTRLPPTATAEVITVQAAGFVFSDDFENGPDPLWEIQFGEPGMANGNYTALSEYDPSEQSEHFALLSDHYWENVRITFELLPFADSLVPNEDAGLGVFLHYQEDNSPSAGLIIFPGDDGTVFGYFQNRIWEFQSSSLVELGDLGRKNTLFSIEIMEETYKVYIDGLQVSSATLPGPTIGQVALWFITSSVRSDPENFAPRIENITIESLP